MLLTLAYQAPQEKIIMEDYHKSSQMSCQPRHKVESHKVELRGVECFSSLTEYSVSVKSTMNNLVIYLFIYLFTSI